MVARTLTYVTVYITSDLPSALAIHAYVLVLSGHSVVHPVSPSSFKPLIHSCRHSVTFAYSFSIRLFVHSFTPSFTIRSFFCLLVHSSHSLLWGAWAAYRVVLQLCNCNVCQKLKLAGPVHTLHPSILLCCAVQKTLAAVKQEVTNTCAAAVVTAESNSSKAKKAVNIGSKVQCWPVLCRAL